MEQQITYSAEQMLEDIFLYMSQLVDEKDFSKVVSLLILAVCWRILSAHHFGTGMRNISSTGR